MNLKKPEDCRSAEDIRNEIDKIDKKIISLFSTRHKYIEEIVRFKQDEDSVVAADRKKHVIMQRGEWAEKKGLENEIFRQIYTLLIESNIKHEFKLLQAKKTDKKNISGSGIL